MKLRHLIKSTSCDLWNLIICIDIHVQPAGKAEAIRVLALPSIQEVFGGSPICTSDPDYNDVYIHDCMQGFIYRGGGGGRGGASPPNSPASPPRISCISMMSYKKWSLITIM